MSGAQTGTDIDRILESGREGLTFFATFLPRYRSWTGANPQGQDEDSLTAAYEQQCGMDVEPLRSFAVAVKNELNGSIGNHIGVQQARYGELPSHWSGSAAADSAQRYVQDLGKKVSGEHDTLTGIAQAASTAADTLEQVVRAKADTVRTDLAATVVAGKSADQVDRIIGCARGAGVQAQQVRQVFPDMLRGWIRRRIAGSGSSRRSYRPSRESCASSRC